MKNHVIEGEYYGRRSREDQNAEVPAMRDSRLCRNPKMPSRWGAKPTLSNAAYRKTVIIYLVLVLFAAFTGMVKAAAALAFGVFLLGCGGKTQAQSGATAVYDVANRP
jgi:hypothetical protein